MLIGCMTTVYIIILLALIIVSLMGSAGAGYALQRGETNMSTNDGVNLPHRSVTVREIESVLVNARQARSEYIALAGRRLLKRARKAMSPPPKVELRTN
jgi:hypothetical protein